MRSMHLTIVGTIVVAYLTLSLVSAQETIPHKLGYAPPSQTTVEHQFDFWIGEWDVVQRHYRDGAWQDFSGSKLVVYPILDGTALVEHFRGPSSATNELFGFSVRAYDPVKKKWVVLLRWPGASGAGDFWVMEGGFHHNRGEIFETGVDQNGKAYTDRFTFSDAIDGYYRWNEGRSTDGGLSWTTRFIMEGLRRNPERDGAFDLRWIHGLDDEPRATAAEFRQLDFLEGSWTSNAEVYSASGEPVRSTVHIKIEPILGQNTQMMSYQRIRHDGSVHEAFVIQSYDPRSGHWIAYNLNKSGQLRKYIGTKTDRGMVFLEEKDDGDKRPTERFTWTHESNQTLSWTLETLSDDGTTWKPNVVALFKRDEGRADIRRRAYPASPQQHRQDANDDDRRSHNHTATPRFRNHDPRGAGARDANLLA